MFIGRENELNELNMLYEQDRFHLFVLYGRRRVGKTTLLNEFCKNKDVLCEQEFKYLQEKIHLILYFHIK